MRLNEAAWTHLRACALRGLICGIGGDGGGGDGGGGGCGSGSGGEAWAWTPCSPRTAAWAVWHVARQAALLLAP